MIGVTDLELIKLVKNGDDLAFEKLINRYKASIYKISRKYHIHNFEIEDFYQIGAEAFYKATLSYNEAETYSFFAYSLICVRNKIISQWRKSHGENNYTECNSEILLIKESKNEYVFEKSDIFCLEVNEELYDYRQVFNIILENDDSFTELERNCLKGVVNGLNYDELSVALKYDKKKIENAMARVRIKVKNKIKNYEY